ncbi:MAG: Zn-ribbon domain-containing OB-fold protein [Chloroflexi bacterium]|nr:Zn-ribbon domain-containing OB-fold protein [Chloroflexota bacterium]
MTTEQGQALSKPLPRPEHAFTDQFWDACQRHELIIPYCTKCSRYFWYPRQECPFCLEGAWEWRKVSGKGRVYTFTLVRQPGHPAFAEEVPYPYAIIQLDEGVRLISNVVGIDPLQLQCEQRVEVVFEEASPDVTLFKFRPIPE